MAVDSLQIEVTYASENKQRVISLEVPIDSSVENAILLSGILDEFPEIDLQVQKTGIYGQLCSLETKVVAGNRIEIYRPLLQNPMQARRNRIQNQ